MSTERPVVPKGGLNSNLEFESLAGTDISLTDLFDALENWEYQLKHADIDFEELGL